MPTVQYKVDVRDLDLRERWELLDEIRWYQIGHGEMTILQTRRLRNEYVFLIREEGEGLRKFFEGFGVRTVRENI